MVALDKYCRLCLSKEDVNMELFANADKKDSIPLFKQVMRCASVKIRWGDGLPSLLCRPCADRVNSFVQFKESCEHVDASLRKLFKEQRKKNDDYWEDKIQSIYQEIHMLSSFKPVDRNSELELFITQSENDVKEESRFKVETVYQSVDDGTWLESTSSPASPNSPSPAPSPSSHCKEGDDSLETNTKKRKRKKSDHTCEFCGRMFHRSNHLAQHELTHTAEKPFQCSDCEKSFWYKASLIGHIKQTHTGDVNYTCELCGKGFFKKTELTRHKPTHSNETPHKCPQCGMGFKIPKTLKRHIRNVHMAQRSHTCHTCGKSFTQLQTLKVHLVLHSGVKPYVCSYCGKGFSQSAPLKTHIRIHTGEKPYTCHACGDTFATRSAFTSHTFKHEGTLPYACSRCSSTFKLKKELIQHEQGHDDEESRLRPEDRVKLERGRSEIPYQLPQHEQQVQELQHEPSSFESSEEGMHQLQVTRSISASHTAVCPYPDRQQVASSKASSSEIQTELTSHDMSLSHQPSLKHSTSHMQHVSQGSNTQSQLQIQSQS